MALIPHCNCHSLLNPSPFKVSRVPLKTFRVYFVCELLPPHSQSSVRRSPPQSILCTTSTFLELKVGVRHSGVVQVVQLNCPLSHVPESFPGLLSVICSIILMSRGCGGSSSCLAENQIKIIWKLINMTKSIKLCIYSSR